MKDLLKRIGQWSHTPTGDGILAALAYAGVLIVGYLLLWGLHFIGIQ